MVRLTSAKRPQKHRKTPADLIVVGLGNPPKKYGQTRHNAGAWVVNELAARHKRSFSSRRREQAATAQVRVGTKRLILVLPLTFMNNSGAAVAPLLRRYEIADLGNLVVVHDELDLPVGRMMVKFAGGLAGHNGLKSIRDHVHSVEFSRLRIGIGNPRGNIKTSDYVLAPPSRSEHPTLQKVVLRAADALEFLIQNGREATMNAFNGVD